MQIVSSSLEPGMVTRQQKGGFMLVPIFATTLIPYTFIFVHLDIYYTAGYAYFNTPVTLGVTASKD